MNWVVDAEQVVHATYCETAKDVVVTPYFPQRIVRDDAGKPNLAPVVGVDQMLEHLARPDSSGGLMTHRGPSMLKRCRYCVPSAA